MHGCSFETYLELWRKKSKNNWAFVFLKKFQANSAMHLDYKMWLQIFLLNVSFDGMEIYYSSVNQSLYNAIE